MFRGLFFVWCFVTVGLCPFISGNESFAQEKPLQVFVLVGQSNMQGHADVRTWPHIGMDPETKPLLDAIQTESGEPRVFENIPIAYLSSGGARTGPLTAGFGANENKMGPELTFGVYMQKRLDAPILIIKAAWGGKSLNTDFRPPSAGPYEFDESAMQRMKDQGKDVAAIKEKRTQATGVYYRQTIEHVQSVLADIKSVYPDYDADQGYELAGMVWFQGWNDMVDSTTYPQRSQAGGYDQYSELLTQLIQDFRNDLAAPELPFVIGVMGVGGPTAEYGKTKQRHRATHQNFRDAMARPAASNEFEGNVAVVLTESCWDQQLGELVARDGQIKSALKKRKSDGEIQQSQWKGLLEQLRSEEFSAVELETLQTGVSNAEYHYLGSGKVMARIGKAFAEAMPMKNRE